MGGLLVREAAARDDAFGAMLTKMAWAKWLGPKWGLGKHGLRVLLVPVLVLVLALAICEKAGVNFTGEIYAINVYV